MKTYVPGHLWGEELTSIDNTSLTSLCLDVEKMLESVYDPSKSLSVYGSKSTANYTQYNLLTYPHIHFFHFYQELKRVIKPEIPDEPHMIQCWLNVFRKGEFINWHNHWEKEFRAYHGFYCVNVKPSYTEYMFHHHPRVIYKVNSKEGLLVFGKSHNNQHRSSPWLDEGMPRITIAFDIIPVSTIQLGNTKVDINHLIPF